MKMNFELRLIAENNYLKFIEYLDDNPISNMNVLNLNDLEYVKNLYQENQLLKKQVDKGLYNTCLPYTTGYNKAIEDKEIQQKEFIEWLEDYLKLFDDSMVKEILQKYKSIVGVSEWKMKNFMILKR